MRYIKHGTLKTGNPYVVVLRRLWWAPWILFKETYYLKCYSDWVRLPEGKTYDLMIQRNTHLDNLWCSAIITEQQARSVTRREQEGD